MPAFGAALSTHPVTAHATGEVVGQVTDQIGRYPDLAVLVATPGHAGAFDDVGAAVRALLGPAVLLGVAAAGVLGPGGAVPGPPAMALWAGMVGPLRPLRLRGAPSAAALEAVPFRPGGVLLLADHQSFPAATWAAALAPGGAGGAGAGFAEAPAGVGVPLAGGTVGGGTASGGPAHLLLDAEVAHDGAIGVVLGASSGLRVTTLPGTRPVGPAYEVTRAEGRILYELDGRPAMQRLREVARDHVPASELPVLERAVHLAPAADAVLDHGGADAVRVLGADRANGAIATPVAVPPGTTIRFHLPDPEVLGQAARRVLGDSSAEAALAFCSAGGLPALAAPLASDVGPTAVAGLACSSQLGRPGADRDGPSTSGRPAGLGGAPDLGGGAHSEAACVAVFGGEPGP